MRQTTKAKDKDPAERWLDRYRRLEEAFFWKMVAGIMAGLSLGVVIGVAVTLFFTWLCFFIKIH